MQHINKPPEQKRKLEHKLKVKEISLHNINNGDQGIKDMWL
jgi:hypothetical protein